MHIVYLDQNKWIQVARAFHGRQEHSAIVSLANALGEAVADRRVLLPLSEINYMEIARIRDVERRSRLGKVMWALSRGFTLASQRQIVEHELAVGLSKHYPHIEPGTLDVIGRGISHAFGEKFPESFPEPVEDILEEAMLTGEGPSGEHAPPLRQNAHKQNFANHLANLPSLRDDRPESKLDDALYAIAMVDILEPFNAVALKFDLPATILGELGRDGMLALLESMPSRRVDIHLHRQMLKNPALRPKLTDLEDWSGLGKAVQYSDCVVCEKHFASLIARDGFKVRATVHSELTNLQSLLACE